MTTQDHNWHSDYMRKCRKLPTESLEFIIRDCKAALVAMPDNPKAGIYADEINYCAMELASRRKAQ